MSTIASLGTLRREIRKLLEASDYEGLTERHGREGRVLRLLISMTYDKADETSWRAMEAIGRIAATLTEEVSRNLVQRLLWMMREESGTNAWSAGEIIAEIVRNNPGPFEDIVPIVISFHDEKILRTGSLWFMIRVGEARPDLVEPFEEVAVGYLDAEDPMDRGHALLALKTLGRKKHLPLAGKLLGDTATLRYYDGKALIEKTIGAVAAETVSSLKG